MREQKFWRDGSSGGRVRRRVVRDIVQELVEHRAHFKDWGDPGYYNITTFKAISGEQDAHRERGARPALTAIR